VNLLITGASGFIGFNLSKYLLNNTDFEIYGVDSLNNAYDNNIKDLRTTELNSFEKFHFYNLDLSSEASYQELKSLEISCVVHLAARAGVRQSFLEPKKYIIDNTISTANLSSFIKNMKIDKFLIASTSSIYGDSGENKVKEGKDEKYPPPSVYATTKLSGELLAKTILDGSNTSITIPRFFTVYGPYGRPDMSILRFIHWIYSGEEILLFGDGEQKRSFTFIDDVISALNLLINTNENKTYNIGSNTQISLINVINKIETMLNKQAKINHLPRALKDVDVVIPDLSNMESLGWESKIEIDEGLSRTIDWYLENKEFLKDLRFVDDYEK
jgi:UDP-glucuronate 4-epimerase